MLSLSSGEAENKQRREGHQCDERRDHGGESCGNNTGFGSGGGDGESLGWREVRTGRGTPSVASAHGAGFPGALGRRAVRERSPLLGEGAASRGSIGCGHLGLEVRCSMKRQGRGSTTPLGCDRWVIWAGG